MRIPHERFSELLAEVQRQHPEDKLAQQVERVYYRAEALHPKPGFQWRRWLLLAIAIVLLSHWVHAQTQPVNIDRVAGTKVGVGGLNVTCVAGCGAGGGGVTIADGADVTQGAKADAASTATDATPVTIMQVLKQISKMLQTPASTPVTFSSPTVNQGTAGVSPWLITAANLDTATSTLDTDIKQISTDLKSNIVLAAGGALIGKAGFDSTTPGATNGVSQAQPTRTTGTLVNVGDAVSVSTRGYASATVTVSGTYSGQTITFEFSDDSGTTYYAETCTRTDASQQVNSDALPSNTNRAYDCGVYAASNFRVRLTSTLSGTANIGITLSAAPIEPAATVAGAITAAIDQNGNATALWAPQGVLRVQVQPPQTRSALLWPCNALRKTNCQ